MKLTLFLMVLLSLLLPMAASGPASAFNKQNPRWEAPERPSVPKPHNRYRPQRESPEALPAKPNNGRSTSRLLSPAVSTALAGLVLLALAGGCADRKAGLPPPIAIAAIALAAYAGLGMLKVKLFAVNPLLPALALGTALLLFHTALEVAIRSPRTLARLVTPAVLATWAAGSGLAFLLLGGDVGTALILGTTLIMLAPPIVVPRLRRADEQRPDSEHDAPALEVVGAFLTVVVFEAILAGGGRGGQWRAVGGMATALSIATVFAAAATLAARFILRSAALPTEWHRATVSGLLVAAVTASNLLCEESGLLTATLMGLGVAIDSHPNAAPLRREPVWLPYLLASLVLLLAATNLHAADPHAAAVGVLVFAGLVVAAVRPAAVVVATRGLKLDWVDRAWLTMMTPRGILAAGIATVLGLRLWEIHYPAGALVPLATLLVAVLSHAIAALANRIAQDPTPGAVPRAEASAEIARD